MLNLNLCQSRLLTVLRGSDTAEGYRNEAAIGAALSRLLPGHSLGRQDVFITSKLGNTITHFSLAYADSFQWCAFNR